MEGRAEDLSQVRPEWGHATNAVCIVGRRARTRGLFLDRRAFLNSYDPTQDDADGWECQHALSTVTNVVVEAWACSYGAGDEAAEIAARMVDNVIG